MSWLEGGGVLLAIAGVVAGVIYWIRRGVTNQVDLQASKADAAELRAHVAQVTAADNAASLARIKEFDAKADSVRSGSDAAALLRGAVAGTDDPSVN